MVSVLPVLPEFAVSGSTAMNICCNQRVSLLSEQTAVSAIDRASACFEV